MTGRGFPTATSGVQQGQIGHRWPGQPVWREIAIFVGVLALAAFFRLYRIDVLPPGFYVDEAYNAFDALRILEGARPIFLPSNQGREPLYSYLQAIAFALFGPDVLALRLTSVFIGLATIGAGYAFVRTLPLRRAPRIALLTAILLAITFWHVHYSRYGIRSILVPFLALLACTFYWRGQIPNPKNSHWALVISGVFLAAGAYTHPIGRLVPLILVGFTLYRIVLDRRRAWRELSGLAIAGIVAAVLVLPLARYYLENPGALTNHPAQVSIFSDEVIEGSPARTLALNVLRVAGMFNWRGDPAWNQNLAGRPVFDPLMGIFFLIGIAWLAVTLVRPREDPRERDVAVFIGLWLAVMLSASIFSGNAPHFTRAIGALPAVVFLPAVALDRTWAWLDRRGPLPLPNLWFRGGQRDGPHPPTPFPNIWERGRQDRLHTLPPSPKVGRGAGGEGRSSLNNLGGGLGRLLIAGILIVSGAWTFRDYFLVYANRPELYSAWDGEQVDISRYLNQVVPDYQVYLLSSFLRHTPIRFMTRTWTRPLLEATEGLVLPGQEHGQDALYVLVEWDKARVGVVERLLDGAAERQDLTGSPGQPLLTVFRVPLNHLPDNSGRLSPPLAPQHGNRVQFGGQVELLGFNGEPQVMAGGYPTLTLFWRRLRELQTDYTLFVHVIDAQGNLWGQHDKEPLGASYRTRVWAAGDVVVDRFQPVVSACAPPGTYRLVAGIYERQSGERLPVTNGEGNQADLDVLTVLPGLGLDLDEVQPQHPVVATLTPGLSLLGFDGQVDQLRPGDPLAMNLYWHVRAPVPADTLFTLRLRTADGRIEELWHGPAQVSPSAWPPNRVVCDHRPIHLPPMLPAGRYTLEVALGETSAALGELTLLDQARQFNPPNPQHSLQARLGNAASLIGYDLPGCKGAGEQAESRGEIIPSAPLPLRSPASLLLCPPAPLRLILYWQASGATDQSYTVFVHLLDSGGRIRAQQDNPPVGGQRPTTGWVAGEFITDTYTLSLPPDAEPGSYQIVIGMYDPRTGTRLPAFDANGQRQLDDRLPLGQIEVQP